MAALKIFSIRISGLLVFVRYNIQKKLKHLTLVLKKNRQPCRECAAPRPERIKVRSQQFALASLTIDWNISKKKT